MPGVHILFIHDPDSAACIEAFMAQLVVDQQVFFSSPFCEKKLGVGPKHELHII